MIKAVIFDWAGVIGVDAYWVWLGQQFPDLEPHRPYFKKISEEVDAGEISNQQFVQKIQAKVDKPAEQIWQEIKALLVVDTELVAFIKELKKGHKVALLSNFTETWLREILSENDLWDLFDHHIISSEHKMIKPDPRIFHKMLGMLEIEASEAVFVDDRQYNVDASNALGIKAFLYTDLAKCKADLATVGVKA